MLLNPQETSKNQFRTRAKRYTSAIVRLYVELPRSRKEVVCNESRKI